MTEVYYMLAECKWGSGDIAGAAELINIVRKRNFTAGVDPDPVTIADLDKYRFLDDWSIEFLGEGRRRTYLIRWDAFATEAW
ncbi:RagB/SusD family nutrient uptake outer membrane protein [Sphingobacterium paludis]|uniref:SusD-like starch-binding protein associating with outer membrane n=1 Tax=Sphingobacterium paludis TaxID=1476465 RepID=A0A4R7CS10_9SPHI|nr:RagB/SusD family nutrient uptake outer membrane protein [Sphingobacterium paludis]TDS06794.1 SusD-like starch-binding protein associating with outer membrane [Sphingobacterium paludis]